MDAQPCNAQLVPISPTDRVIVLHDPGETTAPRFSACCVLSSISFLRLFVCLFRLFVSFVCFVFRLFRCLFRCLFVCLFRCLFGSLFVCLFVCFFVSLLVGGVVIVADRVERTSKW